LAWRCPAAAWPRSRTNPRCQVRPTAKPAGTAQSGRVAKLAGAAVTGLFGAIVCTPPYAIARGGIYLLGSHFALGVPKPRSRLLTCSFLKRPADPPTARQASGLCEVHDRYSAGTHPARVRHRRSSSRLTRKMEISWACGSRLWPWEPVRACGGRYGSGGLDRGWSVWVRFGDAAEGDFEAEVTELADVALAENLIRAAHATCWYSWSTRPSRSRRRTSRLAIWPGLTSTAGSGWSGRAFAMP